MYHREFSLDFGCCAALLSTLHFAGENAAFDDTEKQHAYGSITCLTCVAFRSNPKGQAFLGREKRIYCSLHLAM